MQHLPILTCSALCPTITWSGRGTSSTLSVACIGVHGIITTFHDDAIAISVIGPAPQAVTKNSEVEQNTDVDAVWASFSNIAVNPNNAAFSANVAKKSYLSTMALTAGFVSMPGKSVSTANMLFALACM